MQYKCGKNERKVSRIRERQGALQNTVSDNCPWFMVSHEETGKKTLKNIGVGLVYIIFLGRATKVVLIDALKQ